MKEYFSNFKIRKICAKLSNIIHTYAIKLIINVTGRGRRLCVRVVMCLIMRVESCRTRGGAATKNHPKECEAHSGAKI